MSFDQSKIKGYLSNSAQALMRHGSPSNPRLHTFSHTLHKCLVVEKGVTVEDMRKQTIDLPEEEQAVLNGLLDEVEAYTHTFK